MNNKAIEQAVEDLTKITSTIDRVVVDIESDTLVAAPVKNILEMITSRINASIQALQAEPQHTVDVGDIIGDFEQVQFLLGYPQLEKKDAVVLGHFLSHLQTNGYLHTPPESKWQPIETAPEGEKDGVLLWEPSFYQGRGGLAIGAYTKEYGWLCNGGKGSEATHWQPRPEPPMKGLVMKRNCPKCGVSPYQFFNLGCIALCHICNTKWKCK